jgi:7-cyano-7-deazaguanine synthase
MATLSHRWNHNEETRDLTKHQGARAIALVSGGLDSVVSLARAVDEMDVRLVLFVNYGQRAVERERHAVMGVVDYYGLPFREVELPWLGELSPQRMRLAGPSTGAERGAALDTLESVWIPNRNGVFLNVAAAFAESYNCRFVVTGFNREEAEEFPDNGAEYVEKINRGFELSTRNGVRIMSFTQDLAKSDILELGVQRRAPLSIIWSCYEAGRQMCGSCMSCRRLKAALNTLDVESRPPIEFAD